MKPRHTWDIFNDIVIRKMDIGQCNDCDLAFGVDKKAVYAVLLYFRGDKYEEHGPYGRGTKQWLGICEVHIGYWQRLVVIHQEGLC